MTVFCKFINRRARGQYKSAGQRHTIMRYYAKFHDGSQTKNKAQNQALEFMKTFASTLLGSDAALNKMVNDMGTGVDLINRTNTRCSDIAFRKYLDVDYRGKSISVGEICSYSFYPVLNELNLTENETLQDPELILKTEHLTFIL